MTPDLPAISPRARRRGFSIVELLVVIAIIALLVGILLTALGAAQRRAKQASTEATIRAFVNACEAFQQDHGYYPGVVPEDVLAYDTSVNGKGQLSGTENALLHLMGGYVVRGQVAQSVYDNYGGLVFSFEQPGTSETFDVRIDLRRIGEGPVIDGESYEPYFTPSERDLAAVPGQMLANLSGPSQGNDAREVPDLVDAWGQPIMYLRRQRPLGTLVPDPSSGSALTAQFNPQSLRPYLDSPQLGRLGRDQVYSGSNNTRGSILTGINDQVGANDLALLLRAPAIAEQARGAFMVLSAGADGVFLSAADGVGTSDEPEVNPYQLDSLPANLIDEYDDLVVFGGTP